MADRISKQTNKQEKKEALGWLKIKFSEFFFLTEFLSKFSILEAPLYDQVVFSHNRGEKPSRAHSKSQNKEQSKPSKTRCKPAINPVPTKLEQIVPGAAAHLRGLLSAGWGTFKAGLGQEGAAET